MKYSCKHVVQTCPCLGFFLPHVPLGHSFLLNSSAIRHTYTRHTCTHPHCKKKKTLKINSFYVETYMYKQHGVGQVVSNEAATPNIE